MSEWRDRIIETQEGNPAELVKMLHPDNPKGHPDEQMEGLEHSLNKVGWIDRPIWNKRTNYFIDGNGRVKLALMAGQSSIKYDVVDLSPEEEQYVLATFDPLGLMAEMDAVKLLALMENVGEDLPQPVSEHLMDMIGVAGYTSPPSLDELEQEYGEPQERDFWPYIKVQVSPDTKIKWDTIMSRFPEEDEAMKVECLLGEVDKTLSCLSSRD